MSRRLVVLSDTHMPRRNRSLPRELVGALRTADLIVHLGDFTGMEVVTFLEAYAPLIGVHGNNDSDDIRARFPATQRIEMEGKLLVLLHGDIGGRSANVAARATRGGDVVLFGHSHHPLCSWEGGRLLFNPGSPTDKRWADYRAYGVLEIGETIEATLIPLR
jgi:putative phosphoesterase